MVCVFTSSAESWTAWPRGVVPGKASQRIPVQWGVETIVDAWVLLPHQHLNMHTTKQKINMAQWWNYADLLRICFEVSFHSYHDNQGHVCWPQSFKSFWCISGPSVVEGSTGNIKPSRRVNGQLPIDIVLVPFTLQHWDTKRETQKQMRDRRVNN